MLRLVVFGDIMLLEESARSNAHIIVFLLIGTLNVVAIEFNQAG